MPTYTFTGPDGKRYKIKGEGSKEDAIRAAKQKLGIKTLSFGSEEEQRERHAQKTPVRSFIASALKGVPFVGEYLDEGIAAATGNPEDAEQVRAMQSSAEKRNPTGTMVAQGATGIAATLPFAGPALQGLARLPMAGRVAAGIGIGAPLGAVEGGISGYGSGVDPESRGANAQTGAMIGAGVGGLVGGAAPMVEAGVRRTVGPMIDRFTVGQQARQHGLSRPSYQILTRAMDADGSLTGQGRQNIARAGPDAMLADSGPNSRAILDTAVQRSGRAGNIARDAIEQRATRARGNVEQALDSTLGPIPAPGRLGYSQGTNQAYDAARAATINTVDPRYQEIQGLLQNRVPIEAINEANDQLRIDGLPRIDFKKNPDGTVTLYSVPDTTAIDYIARGLGASAQKTDTAGAMGGQTPRGRAMRELQMEIRNRLRGLNPDYGQALDSASTEIGQREAREFGTTMLRASVSRADAAEMIQRMPQVERQRVAEGVRQAIDDTLANVRQAMTDTNMDAREAMAGLRELSSRQAREKIEMIIGPVRAEGLFRQMDRAAAALELRAGVRDNSRTFARLSMDEAITDQVDGGMVNQMRSGQIIPAGRSLIASALGRSPEDKLRIKDETYEELVRALTGPRGLGAMRQLQTLETIGRRLPRNEEIARAVASGTAGAAAVPAYQKGKQWLGGRGGR